MVEVNATVAGQQSGYRYGPNYTRRVGPRPRYRGVWPRQFRTSGGFWRNAIHQARCRENMVQRREEIAENRYREEYGRYYEDFEIGDVYEHAPGRTVTPADNKWFTLLTMNNHPVHFDDEYARTTEFEKPLVNSCLTLSIVVGMSVSDVSYRAVANLGWNDVTLPSPVFEGDTLTAETEVLSKRESESRPGDGIVTVRTTGFKQTGEPVLEFERTVLVSKRPDEQ